MKYALIEEGVVVQLDCHERDGFIEVSEEVLPGFLVAKDGSFEAPPPTPKEYSQLREHAYPDIGDQLDAIMKWVFTEREIGLPDELVSLAAKCMSVKAQYPKPDK